MLGTKPLVEKILETRTVNVECMPASEKNHWRLVQCMHVSEKTMIQLYQKRIIGDQKLETCSMHACIRKDNDSGEGWNMSNVL